MGILSKITSTLSDKTTVWGALAAIIFGSIAAIANVWDRSKKSKEDKELGAAQQRDKQKVEQDQKVQDVNQAGKNVVVDIKSGKLRSDDGAKIPD